MREQDRERIDIFVVATLILFVTFLLIMFLNISDDYDRMLLFLGMLLFSWVLYLIYCFKRMLENSDYYMGIMERRDKERL